MKTRKTFIAAAIVAVMACSAAHAQVLGGNVGGAVNGALGGGLRDTSVVGNGNVAGSFGGELDTGSTLRKTRGMSDDVTGRARNAGTKVRNRTESTVATAHDVGAKAATSTVAAAHSTKDQVDAAKLSTAAEGAASHSAAAGNIAGDVDGSASGNASASREGVVAGAVADSSATANLAEKKVEAQQPTPASDTGSTDRNDKR
jgi:hypothetical protein